ncbi:ABC transporter ATP-binding protein [Granulicella sp. WH15]|uniref:ABC transporter ATP-binding protein n=1 Tax=Granulicella sp. WH15 TaxID=2602070 RepID=UPI0013673558|nr:ABC transporter ATP-binding protein [Granulicella sp. WH15]QHN02669.1 ABC transporter ATP-binding protein [Granulicella sp. WH15]
MELVIRALSKTYRSRGQTVHALAGIDLAIRAGLFGLLGPNGAGKSTFMNTLATLQRPDSGSIHLDSLDVLADAAALRARLGYLPQDFGVYPGLSAVELLDYLARLKGIEDSKQRHRHISELLSLVNLEAHKNRAVDTYSGGMRQRFGVAQALLGKPDLVIVDEPTAGLDPAERNRLHRMLAEISERTIVILSTHIVEDVSNLCPRMAILDRGQIRLQGSPDELVQNLSGTLWQALLTASELAEWKARTRVVSTRMSAGKNLLVVQAESSPGAPFREKTPDLEDVYFITVPQGEES